MEKNYLETNEGILNSLRHLFMLFIWFSLPFLVFLNQKIDLNMAIIIPALILTIVGSVIALPLNFKTMGKLAKSNELLKSGPYQYCRNPFYLGQTMSVVGLAFILFCWANVIFVLFFLVLTHLTVKSEEAKLEKKFRYSYRRYKMDTPRYFPKQPIIFLKSIFNN